MGPVCKFSDPFWPQIVPKLGRKPVFHLFCKRLPLDSHETCLLSSMELPLKVCKILALDSHGSCFLSSLELLFGGGGGGGGGEYGHHGDCGDCSPLLSGFCTPILCIILGSLWTGLVLSYPVLFRWSLLTGFCTPWLYIRKVVAIDRLQ